MYCPKGNKDKYELVDPNLPPIAGPWESYFAWLPVSINGEKYWLTSVFRRVEQVEIESSEGHNTIQVWRYGTSFDILSATSRAGWLTEYGSM